MGVTRILPPLLRLPSSISWTQDWDPDLLYELLLIFSQVLFYNLLRPVLVQLSFAYFFWFSLLTGPVLFSNTIWSKTNIDLSQDSWQESGQAALLPDILFRDKGGLGGKERGKIIFWHQKYKLCPIKSSSRYLFYSRIGIPSEALLWMKTEERSGWLWDRVSHLCVFDSVSFMSVSMWGILPGTSMGDKAVN